MPYPFTLAVPLDASGVANFEPSQNVKVLVVDANGKAVQSTVAKLDAKGHGTVNFGFAENPGAVRIILGPETASDAELPVLNTIGVDVAARQFDAKSVTLPPVVISSYYWEWWPRWCRTFTVTGRVVCADGSPVPGAKVCAYDVDFWWWWLSKNQVGCATTDATGTFKMQFRWCCGFFPWWWWRLRNWQYEPKLAEVIAPVLRKNPALRIPTPHPQPDPAIFTSLLGAPPSPQLRELSLLPVLPKFDLAKVKFDPGTLAPIQKTLTAKLPVAPELERLRLWPWYPWTPWLDCSPDIIFTVTQNCKEKDVVIVDENIFQTRWDIPTSLNVTLQANSQACCIPTGTQPPGNCMVIAEVCDILLKSIGGNPGAPATPAGFVNPGLVANTGDRPFAEGLTISGLFGSATHADFYEFEYSTGGPFTALPPASAGGFYRYYWGPQLGGGPVDSYPVLFGFNVLNGQNVVESREHFEATNDPASWGTTRFWISNRDVLMVWNTAGLFNDGTYHLRVKSYPALGAGIDVSKAEVLPLCDTKNDNGLVVTLDNRINPDPAAIAPCGAGSVRFCVTEPDADIFSVLINGVTVNACDFVDVTKGGTLDIQFLAHDPDGHLELYTLIATYGDSLAVDLLSFLGQPGVTLTPGATSSGIAPALQVGPDYQRARTQGAPAPIWAGGTFHLHIPDIKKVFTKTCCYQLQLTAYKRTIVGCYGGAAYYNLAEYSFMVVV